jgi:hypothetical protein
MDPALLDHLLGRIAAALVLAPACTDRGLGDDDSGRGEQGMGDATSQELGHVELAWAFVAWALADGDERLHAAVVAAFAAAETAIPRAAAIEPAPEDATSWASHGRLAGDASVALASATLRDVVRPSAERMLAIRSGPTASRPRSRERAAERPTRAAPARLASRG